MYGRRFITQQEPGLAWALRPFSLVLLRDQQEAVRNPVRIEVRPGYHAQVVDAHSSGGGAPSGILEGGDGSVSGAHKPMIDIVGAYNPEQPGSIPNYGERYRQGETLSTPYLKGAHLLLRTRTKVLNNELEDVFRRWFPRFRPKGQTISPEQEAA